MTYHPERLGQRPGREGIGGESGMNQGNGTGEILVGQVREIIPELHCREHSLIYDCPRGKACYIAASLVRDGGIQDLAFNGFPDKVELVLQCLPVIAAHNENLPDFRLRLQGILSQNGRIDRHLPGVHHTESVRFHGLSDNLCKPGIVLLILREKNHSHTVASLLRHRDSVKENEFMGYLEQDSRSVARLQITALSSPVSHVLKDCETLLHYIVVLASVNVDHQSDAACIVFIFR